MSARRALALVVLAAGVGGCAAATADERDRAHDTVTAFLASCARGDGVAALDLLSDQARLTFLRAGSVLDGCGAITAIMPPAGLSEREVRGRFAQARISALELSGDVATARLRTPGATDAGTDLESDGRRWRLDGPPPAPR